MKDITVKELTELILNQAKEKGFGSLPEEIYVPEKIAQLHNDISKAYDAYRYKKITGEKSFATKLGDAAQRIFHLAGVLGIDLEDVILKKMRETEKKTYNWKKMNESHE